MTKFLTILLILFVFTSSFAKTKLYKYFDENGGVHYTDVKPLDNEKDVSYQTLKVASGKVKIKVNEENQESVFQIDDFAIAEPRNGSVIQTTNDMVNVKVNMAGKLPSNFRVRFYLDDLPHGKVKSGKQLIADIAPGKHKLYATLLEIHSMKVLKTTETIEFTLEKKPQTTR